jgi:hypothetical protein
MNEATYLFLNFQFIYNNTQFEYFRKTRANQICKHIKEIGNFDSCVLNNNNDNKTYNKGQQL